MTYITGQKMTEWFLRISVSAGFLSAVADRYGLWDKKHSAWGNWESFVAYTGTLNPWFPPDFIPVIGAVATFLEIAFALMLLTTFRTSITAKCSGILLLLFALSMTFSNSIKAPLDYSVFCASAAAFALSELVKVKN
jgi:thiosulfate dehydrogenase (quinone) large subunit